MSRHINTATTMAHDMIAKDRADWLLDAIACATQSRQFLRGDPEYDKIVGEAILLNGEKAISIAISRVINTSPTAVDVSPAPDAGGKEGV